MDLETRKYWRAQINSKWSESWHSWSHEGHWFVFTAKRGDGFFARLYLSYVDDTGKAHKPIIVPQKDPALYDSLIKSCNTPELIIEPVQVPPRKLARAVHSPDRTEVTMPDISMTRKRTEVDAWGPAMPGRE
jgi:hypothetical protein